MEYIIIACKYGGVLALLGTAAAQDLRSRKIKNSLCLVGLALGFALALVDPNMTIKDWLSGVAVSFAAGFALWLLGMFCAGDAKLLCVIGACWGLEEFLSAFVFTLIIGGVFSLFYMMVKKELKLRLLNVLNYFKTMALTMQFRKYTPVEGLKNDMPFSVFILLGAVSSLIYKAIS